MEEDNLFVVDTEGSEVDEIKHFFATLSENLYNPKEEEHDKDTTLFPPHLSLAEALSRCAIVPEFCNSQQAQKEKEKPKRKFKDDLLESIHCYAEELKKKEYTFVTDGIETKKDISHLGMSERQLKKIQKKEREKTKGSKWFNMKAPEMTEELKNDLQVLQMRSVLDPKHFYKRSEMKALPKYFEVGHVVESPIEYHNSKNIRKRNKTLVDELMEDAEFQKFNKKKFKETQAVKPNSLKKFKKKKNKA